MEFLSQGFLETVRDAAIIIGVLYAPLLFTNGILDVAIKVRHLMGWDK